MTTTDPRSIVVDYVEAAARGDRTAMAESFAEHATWTYPGALPFSREWRGRDAIMNDFLGRAGTLFAPEPRLEIALTNVVAEGDQVVAEWTSKGVTLHGHRYDNRCLGVFTVREGRIVSVREYTDTQHAERTLFAEAGGS